MPREKNFRHNSKIDQIQIEAEVIELCHQLIGPLSRYAASLTKQQTIIQNAMQEAFMRFFLARVRGEQVKNPRTWLARALRNCILDRCRSSGLILDLEVEHHSAKRQRYMEAAERQNRDFRYALALLPIRERECLQLRIEGYVYEELAQILRIRKGAIGSLLFRALKHFRKAEASARQGYFMHVNSTDTYDLISQLRLALAETQYRRRVQHRIWTYVFVLGLITAAAALAAVLIK